MPESLDLKSIERPEKPPFHGGSVERHFAKSEFYVQLIKLMGLALGRAQVGRCPRPPSDPQHVLAGDSPSWLLSRRGVHQIDEATEN